MHKPVNAGSRIRTTWRMGCPYPEAFGVERPNELVAGQPAEMFRVVSEWIEMPDRPAVFRQARRLDAGNLLQMGAQVVRVLTAARGFLHQLVELLHENHSLELLHP